MQGGFFQNIITGLYAGLHARSTGWHVVLPIIAPDLAKAIFSRVFFRKKRRQEKDGKAQSHTCPKKTLFPDLDSLSHSAPYFVIMFMLFVFS
jgi:Na+/H+ antiporter NhaD/arsenite permease-like protein